MSAKSKEEIKKVSSFPAKDFFVSMLTRDIDLHDAILDLLDNCVDGAIRSRSKQKAAEDSLEDFWAKIKFDENKFVIEDNCGGIPWRIAHDYAFRMGRPEDVHTKPGTIGVVGIGMKRAIFKIGRECYVHSNHRDDTFLVTIPPAWFENDESWEFPAEREKPATKNYGTLIEISAIEAGARLAFAAGSTFRASFPAMVAESYSYLLEKGFKVTVNDVPIKRKSVRICFENPEAPSRQGKLIRPYIYEARMNDVDVFLAVGYRSRLKSKEEQDEEAESTFAAREAGWTVVCNDRVVLSNDRTVKTGWGFGGVPNFHNQFSCIAGIVDFTASETAKLPITTTKRGIDTSKDLYTLVRQRMQEGLKYFTRNTNRWKGFEHEIKKRFDQTELLDLKALRNVAAKLPFSSIKGDGAQRQYKPDLPVKKKPEATRRISFMKQVADINQVSTYLFEEIREPSEVGETCFDRMLSEATK